MTSLLLLLAACPTCPTGTTCQAPCPPVVAPTTTGTTDLTAVDAYMQNDFWAASGGIGPVLLESSGAAEVHDGIYTVVATNGQSGLPAVGFLMARDGIVPSPAFSVAPPANNEETYCASRGFAWPQFLAGGANPPVLSWTMMPMADAEPAQAKCNGAPIRLEGTFSPTSPFAEYALDSSPTKAGVKRVYVKACTGAACPPVTVGTPDTSGVRSTMLGVGVYSLASRGVRATPAPDSVVSGTGTLYVRRAADTTKPWTVETYCYDGTFRWPRVFTSTLPGGGTGEFWDATFTVTPKVGAAGLPEVAPVTVSCPATQTNRADYCFTTDAAIPCP